MRQKSSVEGRGRRRREPEKDASAASGVPARVWHYTDAAALINMLETGTFWATSAAMMNDRAEIRHGRRLLLDEIRRRGSSLTGSQLLQLDRLGLGTEGDPEQVFLLCATELADSLSQWRGYGAAEYAMEIDTTVRLAPLLQSGSGRPGLPRDEDEYGDSWVGGGGWQKVVYVDEGAADQSMADLLDRILREVDGLPVDGPRRVPFLPYVTGAPDATMTFKHSGFSEEQEVRAVWTTSDWKRYVRYRAGRYGVTPYLEIAVDASDSTPGDVKWISAGGYDRARRSLERLPLPIVSITVGPVRANEHSRRAVEELLELHGYHDVAVRSSVTPYR